MKENKYQAFFKHLFQISSNITQTSNVSQVKITVLCTFRLSQYSGVYVRV